MALHQIGALFEHQGGDASGGQIPAHRFAGLGEGDIPGSVVDQAAG